MMLRSDTPSAGDGDPVRPAPVLVSIPLLPKAKADGVCYDALTAALTQRARLHFGVLPAWWSLVALLPEPQEGPWPIAALRIDKLLAQQLRPIVKAQVHLHAVGIDTPAATSRFTATQMLAGVIAKAPILRVETISCGTNFIREPAGSFFVGNRYDPSLKADQRLAVISEEIGILSAQTGVRLDVSSRSISGPLLEATPWLQVAGHGRGSELVEVIVRGIDEDEHGGRLAVSIRDEVTEIVHSHNALGEWSSDGPILHLVVEVLFAASDADYR